MALSQVRGITLAIAIVGSLFDSRQATIALTTINQNWWMWRSSRLWGGVMTRGKRGGNAIPSFWELEEQ